MANIAHASLTGAELHEPKGITGAASGTVYVSNGAGTGAWANIGTASFTGQVADFATPIPPDGWLECDGSDINTSSFASLYNVMSIQKTGTRTSGSAIVTSLPNVVGFRAGYYVFGTGILAGTTILSIDSPNQITLSANATISSSSSFAVSPWFMNTGTIRLPDLSNAGRYRRSRTLTNPIGTIQADQNQAHTHSVTGSTSSDGSHTHTATVTDPQHSHTQKVAGGSPSGGGGSFGFDSATAGSATTSPASTGITVSNSSNGAHTHTVSGTAASSGSAEARPITMVFMTCIKT